MTKQQPTKLYHTCIVPVNTRTLPFGTYHVKYYWKTFIVKSILAFGKFPDSFNHFTWIRKKWKKQAYKQTTYWHFSPLHTWIPDNGEKIRMPEIKCQGSVLHELIGSYSQLDEILCTWCAHMCREKSRIVENLMSRRTIWLETEYLYNQF